MAKQINGYGLVAIQDEQGEVTMLDGKTEEKIVTIAKPHPRITAQFKSLKVNHRAGQHNNSKMGSILECLMDVPEMADYL